MASKLAVSLSRNNFTHVKILVQGIMVRPQMTSQWRNVPPISNENKSSREAHPWAQFLKALSHLNIRLELR